MSKSDLKPKPKLIFFLKNLGLLWKLKRADRRSGEKFVNSNVKLLEPLYPQSEGNKGPMEEGMIYVMFNSKGKEDIDKIDTVFRFFWVDAPDLRLSVLDSFIVSVNSKSQLS